ncbi:MAG: Helix-turn-helix domain protein [Firmicutes bacterium ADurb.Bin182]|nr:MAG: Helix-turn-helix domain protein [Firmicutes bacterium ADurb.Bin182]
MGGSRRSASKNKTRNKERNVQMKDYTNFDSLPITLSVSDVANVLGISRVGAYNLCHSKGFPSMRIGKRILIPKDRFIQWLEAQSAELA